MGGRFRAHATYANVASTVALFVALGGGAYAAVGNPFVGQRGTIHACVSKTGGVLRVVKAGKDCPRRTVSLAFNQTGQPGANGAPGGPGPVGGTGPSGVAGPMGATGVSGISNYQIVFGTPTSSSGSGENLDSAFAYCPVATKVLGGGFTSSGSNAAIYVQTELPYAGGVPSSWLVQTTSASAGAYSITAYAICATVTS